MEIVVNNLRCSVQRLTELLPAAQIPAHDDRVLHNFLKMKNCTAHKVDVLFDFLREKLVDAAYTEPIAIACEQWLLIILTHAIPCDEIINDSNFAEYQKKCVALATLMSLSIDAKRYATTYFRDKPAPFGTTTTGTTATPPGSKKSKNDATKIVTPEVDALTMAKCCYQLLCTEGVFFRDLWNWSPYIVECLNGAKTNDLRAIYCNHIVAILSDMSPMQLRQLNQGKDTERLLEFYSKQMDRPPPLKSVVEALPLPDLPADSHIVLSLESEPVTNIEGVLLPIFDKDNYKFYQRSDGAYDTIVRVDSTCVNLRSIALGVAAARAICLSGPVGCGKTTLVEYLARKTGRICPKRAEIEETKQKKDDCAQVGGPKVKRKTKEKLSAGSKRKVPNPETLESLEKTLDLCINGDDEACGATDGFLRIQLGDQTDSKMLLGQYRCTDVPGEFIWLPGVLTQAVMNGYWLLLEDLDSATQDTFTILSSLFEQNSLNVPGFRDCVKIAPGFQLFVTVRTNKSSTNSAQKSLFALLEKYLYTVNILPLSRNELCKVVSSNFPKLSTVANRIVDIFLTFSSGDHTSADNLRQQETNDVAADHAERYVSLPLDPLWMEAVPNSGRLVSTRDLVKLCQRSSPMFSVTSTECAYFVFQNAVDVFCSYLPQGLAKTKLIVSIGATLGIIQSRCEYFADEYRPEIITDHHRIKVGRAELTCKRSDTVVGGADADDQSAAQAAKRLKLSRDAPAATFSFTRMASCLLERIAVCVAHKEPVLLVGETGVGKTSAVQYLAERTQHKLVVVNMNNQSDVSDLVGGFKPVDLTYVLAPLRTEFEALFRTTYNCVKNEVFLNKIAVCYNQGSYAVIVRLLLIMANKALEKANGHDPRSDSTALWASLPRWQQVHAKLVKLHAQLQKSVNISFAFIPGSLVNCIKNGDWVLLDEINLASAETLECLSTILEPQGSVVLLERGDFTPVKRHRDFRIFACMNPNTDIGKKDLSVGIRNRFTEFFADDLTTDADLSLLVSDYLSSTGIQKRSVTSIVKLYKQLKQMARLELNDGLGNRPVFSLRTLCRSLRTCAKNLCGSIERNLYESFCMSFLTQLDPTSHAIVLQLIKKKLLSNERLVLRQSIPCPGDNYVNFEGYWIQSGIRPLNECANYILTESVRENLKDLARIVAIGKLPVLLQGPTSAGKTSLIEYVAKCSGNPCLRINNHEHTDLQEYIGTYTPDETGKLTFREGVLVQAMRAGHWIILDELNLAPTDILEALNRVLDDNRELFIPETQTLVRAHANFMLFATQNPPGLYGGRKTLSRAFKNRFIELHFADIPRPELEIILERRCLIPASYAKKMVACMSDLQKNRTSTAGRNVFTLRDLFRWGNRYTYADRRLLEDGRYDWNQHLVEEGYLVLSAKVRTAAEIAIIADTLYRNFRKRVQLERLFDIGAAPGRTSPVARDIIDGLRAFRADATAAAADIVWTRNMTRMAVLTAKALQFDEPVLLVGPTGCGKTTVCQLLARMRNVQLRILNCHMHTEGADFLGGLRPCRRQDDKDDDDSDGDDDDDKPSGSSKRRKLFEWADGPLIHSMQEGSYFMADEISLAEDSVLERLNCILEPERTVLLAEKGGVAEMADGAALVVQAHAGFQYLATMNPGGDFGKKELSPALRNRFTEIWCQPSDSKADLVQIAAQHLHLPQPEATAIARYIVEIVLHMRDRIEKFRFSVRDIIAWANYMTTNARLTFAERAIFGLETIFLDALEMLPHESLEQVEALKLEITDFAIAQAEHILHEKFTRQQLEERRGQVVTHDAHTFGISPFFLDVKPLAEGVDEATNRGGYIFDTPSARRNLFRLLSALTLKKPLLLEGPPGVGKTSIVECLAAAIGCRIVRINLCEHTDLADLFGTDLPAEDNVLTAAAAAAAAANELNPKSVTGDEASSSQVAAAAGPTLGSFVWRDGPLLAALRAENTWILLDELNLAPQSVLEGLNAILDHRGEVYIPELNKTFHLGRESRIFACQNPLKQGGGRKGLPQSFLNRFNKVYLRKLNNVDLMRIMGARYTDAFTLIMQHFARLLAACDVPPQGGDVFEMYGFYKSRSTSTDYDEETPNASEVDATISIREAVRPTNTIARMVKFSEKLESASADLSLGYKGGPFEINLRNMLHWCDLVVDKRTGYVVPASNAHADSDPCYEFAASFEHFLSVLYERMKLVYCQRMRCASDKAYIRAAFSLFFHCDAEAFDARAEDVCLYWTDERVYLNDIVLERNGGGDCGGVEEQPPYERRRREAPLLLGCQLELLKNCVECVHMQKPVLLCGATDSGKTKLIDALCTLSNQTCNTDTIDDSVTGSFQQIDLNRHLEEISKGVERLFLAHIQRAIFGGERAEEVALLWNAWSKYNALAHHNQPALTTAATNQHAMSAELQLFRQRIEQLNDVIEQLLRRADSANEGGASTALAGHRRQLLVLQQHIRHAQSLNTGGSFEWVDSKIVTSLKRGEYILLEHVNLCSSAVLDRLNPIFEPNGELLIAEKGVVTSTPSPSSTSLTSTTSAEIVRKSPNFRAFLTIDPKNGELSRAMRNRCIELALTRDNSSVDETCSGYDVDDMRAIVYVNGMRETSGIECILDISTNIAALHASHNVAHVALFAFLASSYRRIGYALDRALYVSGMEVYVYAAHTDLLGYGLAYYQNKLRDIVLVATARLGVAGAAGGLRPQVDLANVILHSDDLNEMSLVRLQVEPLKLLLAAPEGSAAVPHQALELLRRRFALINFEGMDRATLARCYLYVLYECSSTADVELRHRYLAGVLRDAHPQLLALSAALYAHVRSFTEQAANACMRSQLPWNVRLYPRLRDYVGRPDAWSAQRTLRLSAVLVLQLLLDEVPRERAGKLHEMNALAYSQAVAANRVVNKLPDNRLIKHLHLFVESLRALCLAPLADGAFTLQHFVALCTDALWFNRFLATAREQPLFVDNVPDRDYLDKLLMHFKWLDKRLLRLLKAIQPTYRVVDSDFDISLAKLSIYDQHLQPPMMAVRSTYAKFCARFQPLHQAQQVRYFELTQQLDQLLGVVPLYGAHSADIMLRKFMAQKLEVVQRCRAIYQRPAGPLFDYRWSQAANSADDEVVKFVSEVSEHFAAFFVALEDSRAAPLHDGDLDTLEAGVSAVTDFLNTPAADTVTGAAAAAASMPDQPKDIELGLLALREYFLHRALIGELSLLNTECTGAPPCGRINWHYCEEIATLSSDTWQLINLARSPHFAAYRRMNTRTNMARASGNIAFAILTMDADDETHLITMPSQREVALVERFLVSVYTFEHLYANAARHYQLHNLAVRYRCTAILETPAENIDWRYSADGAALVNCMLRLLTRSDGAGLKPVPLTDLALWQRSLHQMRVLLWQNCAAMTKAYEARRCNRHSLMIHYGKLVANLTNVRELIEPTEGPDYNDSYLVGFTRLLNTLHDDYQQMVSRDEPQQHPALAEQQHQLSIALLDVVAGAVELCLLTYMPLLDPVTKSRLKQAYADEDIDCLRTFVAGYDCMRVMMRYVGLAAEFDYVLRQRCAATAAKQRKYAAKVAVRPPGQCLYAAMVTAVTHYLQTNCDPGTLSTLIETARSLAFEYQQIEDGTPQTPIEQVLQHAVVLIQRIELWIANAQHFVQHTLRPYKAFYQDFMQPLLCALNRLRFGLESVRQFFCEIRAAHVQLDASSGRLVNINRNGFVHEALRNLAAFPHVFRLRLFPDEMQQQQQQQDASPQSQPQPQIDLQMLVSQLDDGRQHQMPLLRAQLTELCNLIAIDGASVGGKYFKELCVSLRHVNKLWLQAEEQRRLKKAADDSLYVNKTRCANEEDDEELLELQQIAEHFPNTAHEDFGEFLADATLEQQRRSNVQAKAQQAAAAATAAESKQGANMLQVEDYTFIASHFIETMERYTHVYYWRGDGDRAARGADIRMEIIRPFRERFRVFDKLYRRHRGALGDWLDAELFGTFTFTISLQQSALLPDTRPSDSNSSGSSSTGDRVYNFYKDANIAEITACTDLLDRIDKVVGDQLDLYPEHAYLLDVRRVVERIRQLPADAPLVRFSTGFQLLRQKLAQWNEVAHKHNNLRPEEMEVAVFVQGWMRLELQCWRQCLTQTDARVIDSAYKYWFFIYNLCEEYRQQRTLDATLADIKYAEQRFAHGETVDVENGAAGGGVGGGGRCDGEVSAADIVRILRQFMEAACYGDFAVRMRLLRAFELYLQHVVVAFGDVHLDPVIAGLHNLHIYFAQFAAQVQETKRGQRAPIEKKLKELVKIESYNKDLSYFSMRNNVARVHRNLNKLQREYEQLLRQKITPVFQPRDATVADYNDNDNNSGGGGGGNSSKAGGRAECCYSLDAKHFVAKQQQLSTSTAASAVHGEEQQQVDMVELNDANDVTSPPQSLVDRAAGLFASSRRVVRRTVTQAQYPQLIAALDELFGEQLARCEHLRQLSVNRSRARPKQLLEAKQILQQKRKALTDLFKTLTQLGLSFKAGLMELTLRGDKDFEDFSLAPFSIETMLCDVDGTAGVDDAALSVHHQQLNNKLDSYYAKCVFKLKLLQNHMLTPLAELGPPNIERIKGFAVDLFVLVRQQRAHLGRSASELYTLRKHLQSLRHIAAICDGDGDVQTTSTTDCIALRRSFERYKRTFARIRYVFEQFRLLLHCAPERFENMAYVFESDNDGRTPQQYGRYMQYCTNVLTMVTNALADMRANDVKFLNVRQIESYAKMDLQLKLALKKLRTCLASEITRQLTPLDNTFNNLIAYIDQKMPYIETPTPTPSGLASTTTVDTAEAFVDLPANVSAQLEHILQTALLALQKLYKKYAVTEESRPDMNGTLPEAADEADDDDGSTLQPDHLKRRLHGELLSDWQLLNMVEINAQLGAILEGIYLASPSPQKIATLRSLTSVRPLLDQYRLMGEYYLGQQLGAHKVSAKMLSTMLTAFVEISTLGFCVPPDLQHDEEGGQTRQDQKEGEGFGLEDGTGEKDASDKLESEDQLDDAKRPEDRKDDGDKQQDDCKEEKGIEMSDDFEGKMQDIEKPEEDDSGQSEDDNEDLNKEMGETEEGADKLDEQIWGDDEEEQPEPEDDKEMNEEDDGKGSKDEKDAHNDLDKRNDAAKNDEGQDEHDKDGLDATNDAPTDEDKRKEQAKDIDDMKEPGEEDEEQTNTYHNELEEPPEAEEMDLGDMNNGDDEHDEGGDERDGYDNPFDIDKMLEDIQSDRDDSEDKADADTDANDIQEDEEKDGKDSSDSEEEGEAGDALKADHSDETPPEENETETEEPNVQTRGEEADETAEDEKRDEKQELLEQSHDKPSKEENVQSLAETENKGSADQVENNDKSSDDVRQEEKLDEQDTGEEKDGVGQAQNDTNDGGHQGVADTKETATQEERKNERQTKEKRKQGRTNEERTLGEAEKNKLKQLKTIDKMKEPSNDKNDDDDDDDSDQKDMEAEEHQHVKEAKSSDKITLDNATEEQTKRIQHQDDEEAKEENDPATEDGADELMDADDPVNDDDKNDVDDKGEELTAKKFDQKSEKPSRSDKANERAEMTEEMEIEGEIVLTASVARNNDTTAHCKEILLDNLNLAQEPTTVETLEMRRLYQQQLLGAQAVQLPQHDDYESWQTISTRMAQNARELCEQLRLILEPTKCTRLRGDYRTGRRINMKKIIPYIASQFRKDKIWLRRTKPAQRDYKITIAIDDSKSMHHNNSKTLTLEAISLVSQALTLLESGRLSIFSFGETPEIILRHDEQFDGPRMVSSLNFDQNKTNIAELLDFVRTVNTEEGASGSDNGLFENLLLVLSDGRNIFSEGKMKVRNAIKLARLQRIFLVYIIIDNPDNKDSILDIQTLEVLPDKGISIKSYLDEFPFPYYVIVRDLNQLPLVLSEAMRQWFELVNSEQ